MQINTLEDGQVVLGTAMQILDRYETMASQYMAGRADFELASMSTSKEFRASEASKVLTDMMSDARKYGKRITDMLNLGDLNEFRSLITKAKIKLGVVGDFQERVAVQEFFLQIYDDSGKPPVDLKNGATYDAKVEHEKLVTLREQLAIAEKLFLEAVAALDVGEPSALIRPQIEVVR